MKKDDLYLGYYLHLIQDMLSEIHVWGVWLEFERSWKRRKPIGTTRY